MTNIPAIREHGTEKAMSLACKNLDHLLFYLRTEEKKMPKGPDCFRTPVINKSLIVISIEEQEELSLCS